MSHAGETPFLALAALLFAATLPACPSKSPPASAEQTAARTIALLPDPPEGGPVTWDSWAAAFTRDYCVECHNPSSPCGGSGCHDAGDPRLFDLRDKAAFVARLDTIRCGVAAVQDPAWSCEDTPPRTFPKDDADDNNPLPTDGERAIVVDWINAGAP